MGSSSLTFPRTIFDSDGIFIQNVLTGSEFDKPFIMGFLGKSFAKIAVAFTRNIDPGVNMNLVGEKPPFALSPLLSSMNIVTVKEVSSETFSNIPVDHIVEDNELLNAAGASSFEACDSLKRRKHYASDGGKEVTFRTGLQYSFDIFG
jgi:hypothetical protein